MTHEQIDSLPAEWLPADPSEAVAWFADVRVPWWVAGGWAIDLFLARQTRAHADFDVGVLRRDAEELLSALKDWDIHEAAGGVLTPLGSKTPGRTVNSLWCRQTNGGPWRLELLLDDSDDDDWVYRRERRVRRKISTLVRASMSGIPYLATEVQLLFKSKLVRPKDQVDFLTAVPHLSAEARGWLREGLLATNPSHEWIGVIERCCWAVEPRR